LEIYFKIKFCFGVDLLVSLCNGCVDGGYSRTFLGKQCIFIRMYLLPCLVAEKLKDNVKVSWYCIFVCNWFILDNSLASVWLPRMQRDEKDKSM
jgi:hypothetical protein